MSSHGSPASSASADSNSSFNREPTLEDLVNYFVASKRSLNTTTTLWSADEMVRSARKLLEENAVLDAENSFQRRKIDGHFHVLETLRYGIDSFENSIRTEFKSLLAALDTSYSAVQSTLTVLGDTRIEPALQPSGTDPRHLQDFIDSAPVSALRDSLRACIDRYNEALSAMQDSKEGLDSSLSDLRAKIAEVPATPKSLSDPSPVPTLYRDIEEHATEAAQCLESLVKHYDLCVTALRNTEGGSAAAVQATGSTPEPSGDNFDGPSHPEPITAEERGEMLSVLVMDAQEVDEVAAEIRDRGTEMATLLSQLTSHTTLLRSKRDALTTIDRQLDTLSYAVPKHIAALRSFHTAWLSDAHPTIKSGIEEWEHLRDFYERFELAYAELIVEVSSRRKRHERARRRAEEVQRELGHLFNEDCQARDAFAAKTGDFLPLDIWPDLMSLPIRYEIVPVSGKADREDEREGEEGTGGDQTSVPELDKEAVQRALARMKRKA